MKSTLLLVLINLLSIQCFSQYTMITSEWGVMSDNPKGGAPTTYSEGKDITQWVFSNSLSTLRIISSSSDERFNIVKKKALDSYRFEYHIISKKNNKGKVITVDLRRKIIVSEGTTPREKASGIYIVYVIDHRYENGKKID